jgi:hypothetical protein
MLRHLRGSRLTALLPDQLQEPTKRHDLHPPERSAEEGLVCAIELGVTFSRRTGEDNPREVVSVRQLARPRGVAKVKHTLHSVAGEVLLALLANSVCSVALILPSELLPRRFGDLPFLLAVVGWDLNPAALRYEANEYGPFTLTPYFSRIGP